MMKKYSLLAVSLCFMASTVFSQKAYFDEVFGYKVTSDVLYDSNYSVLTGAPVYQGLLMDVYEPTGDSANVNRPLIVLAHAGSFLPKCNPNQLPLGDKSDSAMVELCKQFAKRGYVAVSMDYRLGWNPVSTDADVRAGTIMNAVYRGMQDMKSCVRYFKTSANQATYRVDTNKIVVGGSNSGGYMSLAYTSINDTSETQYLKFRNSVSGTPYINMDVAGDWDGRGGMAGVNEYGNPGPTSTVQMGLNLGGAMADTMWQEAGEVPIVSFHGVEDALTPYKTAVVIVASTLQPVVEVSGSHDLSRFATSLGNQAAMNEALLTDMYSVEAKKRTPHMGLYPFPGADRGYEPWAWYDDGSPCIGPGPPAGSGTGSAANPFASKTRALAYIDTIMGYFCPRAVEVLGLPGGTVGFNEYEAINNAVKVFPNPSADIVYIQSDLDVESIQVYDVHGKMVYNNVNERNNKMQLDVSGMQHGLYFVTVVTNEGTARKKIMVN